MRRIATVVPVGQLERRRGKLGLLAAVDMLYDGSQPYASKAWIIAGLFEQGMGEMWVDHRDHLGFVRFVILRCID